MVGTSAGGNGGIATGAWSPGVARALLGWWQLAGVDTAVAARPTAWSGPVLARTDRAPARPAARDDWKKGAKACPPAPEPLPDFATLADLVAWVRRVAPGAPLADGHPDAGILVIGEAPSAEDLATGRPFTGPAGRLLDRMLAAIGLDRTGCYITLLCPRRRLPGPPDPRDIEADLPLTRAHLRLAAPRAILLLGGTAATALTGEDIPISRLRGRPLEIAADGHRARALATFNPAYLLRRPADKALAWADLLAFRRIIAPDGSGSSLA